MTTPESSAVRVAQLPRWTKPGIFVTATATEDGKTTVAAATAAALKRLGLRVGVLKPVASGCPKHPRRGSKQGLKDDDFLTPDGEALALAAGLDIQDESLMRHVSPVRYAAPISPHRAAHLEERDTDWRRVQHALEYWQQQADVLVVEGAGGWLVPLDAQHATVADVAVALGLPVLLVTRPLLGCLNASLLTVEAVRARKLPLAGMVINRVPEHRDLVVTGNLQDLPAFTGVRLGATLLELEHTAMSPVPRAFVDAMQDFVHDWWSARHRAG